MNTLTLFNTNLLNDLMDDFRSTNSRGHSTNVDVIENKEGFELNFDVPGFTDNDLNIEVKNGVLTVSGAIKKEKEADSEKEEKKYIIKERYTKKFTRSFKLPENIDSENIQANLNNGVLQLKVNKKEEEKPKQIKIN